MTTIWTIGHSNHELSRFLELLCTHEIQVVVDVRTAPYSRYSPQFNRDVLDARTRGAGIRYLYLGRELGGRPEGSEFYDEDGHVLYGRLAASSLFLAGVERLLSDASKLRCAMVCSEENPAVCHRHLLVARVLMERGVAVMNIRGDGRIETFEDVETEAKKAEGWRETLFGEEAPTEWKSLRSVLQGEALPSSSEH